MTDQLASLSLTRYTDSVHNYIDTFPALTYITHEPIFNVHRAIDFDAFSLRENATVLAFFAHRDDPAMSAVLSMLLPLLKTTDRLMIIDVDEVKELGERFGITGPTLIKIFKGRVINQFSGTFTPANLQRFVHAPSTARWRRVDAR